MKKSYTLIAGLFAASTTVSLSGAVSVLFQDSPDLAANFTTTGTGTNASIGVVDAGTTPNTSLDGDALRISDTSSTLRPSLFYAAPEAFTSALKVSFDIDITSQGSNVMFRVGQATGTVGAAASTVLGIQLASTGTIVTEQAPSNVNITSAFTPANRNNFTIFYNTTASALDLSSYGGPNSLAGNQWALYVNDSSVASGLSEKTAGLTPQVFAWFSGTGATAVNMDFQLDNIEYSIVPEPSVYAMVLGALALLFVVRRRRTGK